MMWNECTLNGLTLPTRKQWFCYCIRCSQMENLFIFFNPHIPICRFLNQQVAVSIFVILFTGKIVCPIYLPTYYIHRKYKQHITVTNMTWWSFWHASHRYGMLTLKIIFFIFIQGFLYIMETSDWVELSDTHYAKWKWKIWSFFSIFIFSLKFTFIRTVYYFGCCHCILNM